MLYTIIIIKKRIVTAFNRLRYLGSQKYKVDILMALFIVRRGYAKVKKKKKRRLENTKHKFVFHGVGCLHVSNE